MYAPLPLLPLGCGISWLNLRQALLKHRHTRLGVTFFSRVCIRCRVRETAEFLKEILHLSDRDSRLVCMRVIQRTLLKTDRFLFHLLDYSSWSLLHSTTVYEYAHYNVDKVSR